MQTEHTFNYFSEKFADIKILRYKVEGFDALTLKQKKMIYYLSEAALCGRDILFDQNNRYNLRIRQLLELLYTSFDGDKSTVEFNNFSDFTKRVWFSNGIHHHYSMDKFTPEFTPDYFDELVQNSSLKESILSEEDIHNIKRVLFEPQLFAKRVSLDDSKDLISGSANNYYYGVTQEEAEVFYKKMNDAAGSNSPSYGLNSRLEKVKGELLENTYKADGLYGDAIQHIVSWLEKAAFVAENKEQKSIIEKLISFYETGDLATFDEYSIEWVKDVDSHIDFINGFIEVYGDALGIKGSWESVVNFKDNEATKRTEIISENAQWFEDNSPTNALHKKNEVKGVSAKVINAAMLGGDCHPATPIGINLPNAEWIREVHGSKSVTIENITNAYHMASKGDGFLNEFVGTQEEIDRAEKYGSIGGNLHTDLHECLGHGSGKLLDGIGPEALKNHHSTLEETRADLFALYYILDPKLIELGLFDTMEVGKAEYDGFIRNGLITQLVRIEEGKDIEESHMRNRQLIAQWAYETGKDENVIEKLQKEGKTFFVINDYEKLRSIFGAQLKEIQRIKSEGDFEAGKKLIEDYAIKVDPIIHKEVLARFAKLNLAPYAGFLNPRYHVVEQNGLIKDITVSYSENFEEQMLRYSKEYSFLPLVN